jgi:hypothetical protein
MEAAGLEAEHSYVCGSCSNDNGGCVNVHGVLRGPQADGTEALLLVTPAAVTLGEALTGAASSFTCS